MVLLVTAMIVCYAHRAALSVAAPFMMKELHLSPTVMGILLSAFFWSYSLMQMPAGWLVDRLGVKRTYAFGYAFWSIASALTGFAENLITLIAVRVFLGSGAGLSCDDTSDAVAQILKLEPSERRIALYRKTGDSMKLVDEAPVDVAKGDWVRIGIRCESHRTIGYVDDKSVVRIGEGVGTFDLVLIVDAGVTAQFDDLAYWASK